MNTNASLFSRSITAVAVFFSAVGVALRTILMAGYYDGAEGFYTNEILHSVFSYLLVAMAIVIFAAAYIYIKEEKNPFSLPNNRAVSAVSAVAACVFGGFIIYSFGKLILSRYSGGLLTSPGKAAIIMSLFCVVALLFFVSGKSKMGDVRALLCSGNALVLLILVFGLYFDPVISYVNHSVVLCYATSIFLMLATVAEANSYLSRPWLRRYLAFAPTAVVLSFALSIPDFIYAALNLSAPLYDIYYDFIIFALGLYHLVNLIAISMVKPADDEVNADKKESKKKNAKEITKEEEKNEEAAGN